MIANVATTAAEVCEGLARRVTIAAALTNHACPRLGCFMSGNDFPIDAEPRPVLVPAADRARNRNPRRQGGDEAQRREAKATALSQGKAGGDRPWTVIGCRTIIGDEFFWFAHTTDDPRPAGRRDTPERPA